MKKIKKIFLIILFSICLVSCKNRSNSILSGQWFVLHAYHNDRDILNNDFNKKDLFNVPIGKTKILKINNSNEIFLFIDNSNPLKGKISSFDNSKKKIKIFFPDYKVFNNEFNINIDTLDVVRSGIQSLEIRITLRSTLDSIYLKRVEMKNKQESWINKL
jgi:hypothetical protein